MTVRSDAQLTVESEGRGGCRIVVEQAGAVAEIGMTDEQARELVRQLNAHLDRRAAERTLAMLEAERERRCRAERPETLAAQVGELPYIKIGASRRIPRRALSLWLARGLMIGDERVIADMTEGRGA